MLTSCLITLALAAQVALPGDRDLAGAPEAHPSPAAPTPNVVLHDLALLQGPGVNIPTVLAQLTGAPDETYLLTVETEGAPPALLDTGRLDPTGHVELSFHMPPEAFGAALQFRARFEHGRRGTEVGPVSYGENDGSTAPPCLLFDFEAKTVLGPTGGPMSVPTMAGEVISEQWLRPQGFLFGAANASPYPSHPDAAVLFDSFHPTGGDSDLMSPPAGGQQFPGDGVPVIPIEPKPYGRILIIQEHDDGCDDGVCDEPDDEVAGGIIEMLSVAPGDPGPNDGKIVVILRPFVMCSMDLVDVDEEAPVVLDDDGPPPLAGAIVITFAAADPQGLQAALPGLVDGTDPPDLQALLASDGVSIGDMILVPKGPDNSFKRVFFSQQPVVGYAVLFLSSGAIAEFRYHPIPGVPN